MSSKTIKTVEKLCRVQDTLAYKESMEAFGSSAWALHQAQKSKDCLRIALAEQANNLNLNNLNRVVAANWIN